jgi:hypothetical protein
VTKRAEPDGLAALRLELRARDEALAQVRDQIELLKKEITRLRAALGIIHGEQGRVIALAQESESEKTRTG